MKLELIRRYEHTQQGSYPEVEFIVPEGTRELTVRYSVEPPSATVDLGLIDPCGLRGWSGGARTGFTVTPANATPGYLAGLMRPGVWQVLLGLYDLPADGCEVKLEIELQAARSLRWYRGDLHTHTQHSDAAGGVKDLLSAALERGLDFLAVTDHNTISHHADLEMQPSVIAGQEVTTYRGHFTALGRGDYLEFRHTQPQSVQQTLETAFSQRMLRILAHPKPVCPSCDWQWGLLEHFDAFEVWNGPWAALNWVARDRWVAALNAGLRLPAVGGSDRHQPCGWRAFESEPFQVGSPTTWIKAASLSPGDLLNAILEGRTSVSEGPNAPFVSIGAEENRALVEVQNAAGTTLRVFGPSGVQLECGINHDFEHFEVLFDSSPYLRAELTRDWTQAERTAIHAHPDLDSSLLEQQTCMAAISSAVWAEGN